MTDHPAPRLLVALVLATLAAAAGPALGGDVQAALLAWVGAVAAVLLAADIAGDRTPPTPDADDRSAAEARIAELLDAIVAPMLLVDFGVVTRANRAARALLGEHVVGEDVRVAIRHPAAAERLADGALDTAPVELVGLGTLDQRWEMRVDRLSTGQRLVYLVDRTGSYAAERMRVDFVANASHELRTPLASILGYVETLRDEAGADAAVRARFLEVMDAEARRMQRLVDDLISLSRIEADKYRLPDHAVDLAALIEEVQDELASDHEGRGDDVAVELDAALPAATGDRVQLSQMLHNLIGNAMKYGRPGTPVTVRLAQVPGGMLRLTVADRGDGIAPEHLPRLTERFYRVDAGRSRAMGGTGLGLAIVKHIVERHRGRLDIASAPGRGTTVTVHLPRAPSAALSSNGHAIVTQALASGV